jgi:hypothetical protein
VPEHDPEELSRAQQQGYAVDDVFINCRFERIFNSGRGVSKRSVGSAFSDASEDAEEPLKKIADLESLDGVR